MSLETITRDFNEANEALFPLCGEMICANVFSYALNPFIEYLSKVNKNGVKTIYLGMNPGPYGMYRTGIPFADRFICQSFLKVTVGIDKEGLSLLDKSPVAGNPERREVSGKRLWGLLESAYCNAETFFENAVVLSYSPLAFFKKEGRMANIALSDVKSLERKRIEEVSDYFLKKYIDELKPDTLVGIGEYAYDALERCKAGQKVLKVVHPSPANPAANGDWAGRTYRYLKAEGVVE